MHELLARRLRLAHLPTPLWRSERLDQLVGTETWVKRDDMTAGAEAGNKIRKLEYLLWQARSEGASVVVTCGGLQSNHARATALLAASVGVGAILVLRHTDPGPTHPSTANLLLDRLAGAEVRLVGAEPYADRERLMLDVAAEVASRGGRAHVIPEGGSNGLGALGYVRAMREVRAQLDLGLGGGPQPFDAVVLACGSGGTAAGSVLGAREFGVAPVVHAIAVCEDAPTFERIIGRITTEIRALDASFDRSAELSVHDAFKGPGYALSTDEQRRFIAEAGRAGLIVDPVYSGKALFALSRLDPKPKRVLFLHTGGLPGLLAQAEAFAPDLPPLSPWK